MADPLQFPYQPNIKKMLLIFPLLALLAAFLAHQAMTNDRGMILFHVIELEVEGATIALWVFAGILALGFVAGVIRLLTTLQSRDTNYLRVADDGLTLPVGFFEQRQVTVPIGDIQSLKIREVQGRRYLTVVHLQGKTQITEDWLPNKAAFDQVAAALAARYAPPPKVY